MYVLWQETFLARAIPDLQLPSSTGEVSWLQEQNLMAVSTCGIHRRSYLCDDLFHLSAIHLCDVAGHGYPNDHWLFASSHHDLRYQAQDYS